MPLNSIIPNHVSFAGVPSSSSARGHETGGRFERLSLAAKPIERRLRLRNQSLQPALCRRSAEHRDERRLMCSGILPGCFADGGWVAFNVEEVVSNLECFAECGAITV